MGGAAVIRAHAHREYRPRGFGNGGNLLQLYRTACSRCSRRQLVPIAAASLRYERTTCWLASGRILTAMATPPGLIVRWLEVRTPEAPGAGGKVKQACAKGLQRCAGDH
jgi:hypothetical protein